MPPKVSVIIPVYNPGRFIEPCIKSLLEQTLPPGDLEILFVNDGSTDATPARLDQLAREHDHVTVIHQENSGWSGKPRNVGIGRARGDYVQFLDQDDSLAPEAMERMHAIGARNNADIVIGKVTSDFRGVPQGVFRNTIESCTIHDFNLIDSLTPHKMFRRAFLDEHGFRYPEGKRRLEDQLFMVETYLAAKAVSIVGDYPCYFYLRRADGKNAGSGRVDPSTYFNRDVRDVLDAIVAGTEPGEFRDGLLRRLYRVEMLGRISEPAVLNYPEDYRLDLFRNMRALALDYFDDVVPDGLAGVIRVRSIFLREDRLEDLLDYAARCKPVSLLSDLSDLDWDGGTLVAKVSAEMMYGDGEPVGVARRGDRYFLDNRLIEGLVDQERADVTDEVPKAFADVVIRNRDNAIEWFVPTDLSLKLVNEGNRTRMVVSGTAYLDPMTLHGGAPLPSGTWDVSIRMHALGFVKRTRIGAMRSPSSERGARPALLGNPSRLVLPYWTADFGNLSIDVNERNKSWADGVAAGKVRKATVTDGHLTAPLPVVTTPETGPADVRVIVAGDAAGSSASLPAQIRRETSGAVLHAAIDSGVPGPVAALREGEYTLSLATKDTKRAPAKIGTVVIGPGGRAAGAALKGGGTKVMGGTTLAQRLQRSRFRRPLKRVYAALPASAQQKVRKSVGRDRNT